MQSELVDYLSEFITSERLELFNKILKERTKYITVVLEDIYQPHNASAVLRSCDCFGIQDVHVIENRNEFNPNNEVAMGSSKWLNIFHYNQQENNTREAIQQLKKNGYRIVATTPHKNDLELQDFDLTKGKTALVFGSEMPGISDIVLEEADEFLKIPMYGFTESFNISVSAALILYQLTSDLRKNKELNWQLSKDEFYTTKLQWIKNTIKRAELLEKRFWEEKEKSNHSKQ